jgi:hypothetical protein
MECHRPFSHWQWVTHKPEKMGVVITVRLNSLLETDSEEFGENEDTFIAHLGMKTRV